MKRKFLIITAIIIMCIFFSLTAYGAGPAAPVIEGQMPDCYLNMGDGGVTLFTNASSPDGGTLRYQWYVSNIDNISGICAISGAESSEYRVSEAPGVKWYCYAVWNVSGDMESQPVYSRLIRVEFCENNSDHAHKFGSWMVTTQATCTEDGIKTRECDCGYTERAAIPASGHKWDEGKVTKEAADNAAGEKTFICLSCGNTRIENINAAEGEDGGMGHAKAQSGNSSRIPWWGIVLAAAVVIGGGAGGVVIAKKKKSDGIIK